MVSVGYLALTRSEAEDGGRLAAQGAAFRDWYRYLPWEDWRTGRPKLIDEIIVPALSRWEQSAAAGDRAAARAARIRLAFGTGDLPWDEERVLERYELLYEAGLVAEAAEDGHVAARPDVALGQTMRHDHRRIFATAVARLRGKIKYRP